MFGRVCVGPTALFVRLRFVDRFVGFVARFSWDPHYTPFWNRSRSVCRRVSVARQLLTPPGNWASLSATTLTGVCLHRLVQRLYLRFAGRRLLGCSHSCYRHDSLLLIGSSCPSFSHWHSTQASLRLFGSRNRPSQMNSTTTRPFSTVGSLVSGRSTDHCHPGRELAQDWSTHCPPQNSGGPRRHVRSKFLSS